MIEKFYKNHTAKFFKGKKVKSNRELGNRYAKMPAGTIFIIEDKYKGFSLITEKCPCCGIQMLITQVKPLYVDLLEE